jgi:cation diffusion facilitator CzcD-associated flavoprotein CzcO
MTDSRATAGASVRAALLAMNITGRDGLRLADHWADGPQTYLGLMSAGFPNLFMITGPQSPSVLYDCRWPSRTTSTSNRAAAAGLPRGGMAGQHLDSCPAQRGE